MARICENGTVLSSDSGPRPHVKLSTRTRMRSEVVVVWICVNLPWRRAAKKLVKPNYKWISPDHLPTLIYLMAWHRWRMMPPTTSFSHWRCHDGGCCWCFDQFAVFYKKPGNSHPRRWHAQISVYRHDLWQPTVSVHHFPETLLSADHHMRHSRSTKNSPLTNATSSTAHDKRTQQKWFIN